ncbi:MAG: hypothetical protein ABR599_10840, partial [Gemmatimonadota bacterium]
MPDERDRTSDRKAVARDPLEGLGELSGVLRRVRRQDAPGRASPPAPPQATAGPPAAEPRESTDSAVRTRGAGAPDSGLFWDLELDPTPDSAAGRPRPSRAARADSTSRQRGVGGFGPSRRPVAGPRGDPPLESRRHGAAGESLPRSVGDGAAPQAGPEEAPEAPDADAPSPGTPPENGREAAPAAGRPDGPPPRTEGAREGEDVPQAPLTSPADVERRYEDAKRLAAAGEYARAIDAYHEVLRH